MFGGTDLVFNRLVKLPCAVMRANTQTNFTTSRWTEISGKWIVLHGRDLALTFCIPLSDLLQCFSCVFVCFWLIGLLNLVKSFLYINVRATVIFSSVDFLPVSDRAIAIFVS